MKKIKVLLLSICYLLATNGVAFSLHFCSGKINSVKFFTPEKKSCCCVAWEKDCCEDDTYFFKLSDSHEYSAPTKVELKKFDFGFPQYGNSICKEKIPAIFAGVSGFPDSPPKENIPLFLLNRVLLI